MEICKYDYNSKIEYSRFIRKYNKSKYMSTLNIQTFSKGKNIYLLMDKNFFQKKVIIGYAIIYEDLHVICYANDVSQKYDGDSKIIFISDFMIDLPYRNQGLGKYLENYIVNEVYKDKDIILQPDGDGNWFWKKFGFINDEISQHITLILKRSET